MVLYSVFGCDQNLSRLFGDRQFLERFFGFFQTPTPPSLTDNSLNVFHLILTTKSAYHFKRIRKLSYSKIFKAILLSLALALVNVRVTQKCSKFEFSIYLLVVFQFMLYL